MALGPLRQTKTPLSEATVVIERLIGGGRGLSHLPDGRVVFIQRALPGDEVRIELFRQKKSFAEGRVLERLKDGDDRIQPPCDIAHTCGGCPWMPLAYNAQLAAKEHIVADAITRIGQMPGDTVAPIRPAATSLTYRSRVRLIAMGNDIGFRAQSSRDTIDVVTCPILTPPLDALLSRLRFALRPHLPLKHPLQLELMENKAGILCAISGREAEVFKTFNTGPSLEMRLYPGDLSTKPKKHLPFSQANVEGNHAMGQFVLDALKPSAGTDILDVYCGSGNFSIPLLEAGAHVFGIELREQSIQEAKARAPKNNKGTFVSGDAKTWMTRLKGGDKTFDGAIVNPPRTGALEILPTLMDLGPKILVYVSCDPATLARDLRRLKSRYTLKTVQPFDLMPHTFHVESIAVLQRS